MRHVSWEHEVGEKGMIIKTAAAAAGAKGKMKGGEQTGERKGAMCVHRVPVGAVVGSLIGDQKLNIIL